MDNNLKSIAREIRRLALESIYLAQSGHPGGSLSIAEILAVLYFDVMNIDPKHHTWDQRDRFVLSKGHCAPAYYATLALRGYFDLEDLKHLREGKNFLQGHPSMNKTKGVDASTGSLGQGLSIANGMAIYAKRNKLDFRVYCLCGDGEIQEGQIWEAAMTSAHYKLNNLVLFVDANGYQIDGKVADVMNVASIADKFKAFNWQVFEIDGHDVEALVTQLHLLKEKQEQPVCIVLKTIKGKGVSFMEHHAAWHGGAPNREQYEQVCRELGNGGYHE